MKVEDFIGVMKASFYTGVPDSQLRPLCDYLYNTYGTDPQHHIIAANEGNAVGIAAGYHLATGKVPVVYLQNSGEGNVINPLASLMNEKVYSIPCIFIIGWRGEPGVHDEPQHIYQGEVTLKLLEIMGVGYKEITPETSVADVEEAMAGFRTRLDTGSDVAFVVRKGGLTYAQKAAYQNNYAVVREEAIQQIVSHAPDDLFVCTTGKASRELFEIRERLKQTHDNDFLTVGSMGHASSIALGIALQMPEKKVWCIDGDGAVLMHMGSMAVIGNCKPKNLVHVVINNGAHESVGGMPTVMSGISLTLLAENLGYPHTYSIDSMDKLQYCLEDLEKKKGMCFIEIKCSIGSRSDLGRPATSPKENKEKFMSAIAGYKDAGAG